MSGRRRSSTTQSNCSFVDGVESFRAGGDDVDVDVVVAEQRFDAELLGGLVLDDQKPLAARRGVLADARRSRRRGLRWWWAW